MTGNLLLSQEGDIRSLLEEINEVKGILKEVSRELLRIERRVRTAIPQDLNSGTNRIGKLRSEKRPHLNEQAARLVIETLKEKISKGEQVETQLKEYSVKPDLQTFAKILGITNAKLPPKDELVSRISTRLRQSVVVASGIHDDAGSMKKG